MQNDSVQDDATTGAGAPLSPEIQRELKTLARFITIYCDDLHKDRQRAAVTMQTHDVAAIVGHEVILCPDCAKLLAHAFIKRFRCPMNPKPMCKHCPNHCYAPVYRETIRKVMRHSGTRLILRGRLDYLLHLFR